MTKEEFIKLIAQDTGISGKDAEVALKSILNNLTNVLKAKDKLTLVGFGTFEVAERAARTGRNPKTGESIEIAASLTPKFRPGKTLKEAISGKNDQTAKPAKIKEAKSSGVKTTSKKVDKKSKK